MRIFTVTLDDRPVAVVRASDVADAIENARDLAPRRLAAADDRFDAREPDDAEMVGWLERRDDYLLLETA
jgi:hypothetical protein